MDIAPRNIFSRRPPLHQALLFAKRIAPFGALGVLSLTDVSDLDLLMRRSVNLGDAAARTAGRFLFAPLSLGAAKADRP